MGVAQSTPQASFEESPEFLSGRKLFSEEQEKYGQNTERARKRQLEWERQQQRLARTSRPPSRYFDQWSHETRKPADINDMSAEIMVQSFCHLDGHRSNFRTLALTCRRFRDLLKSDEYRIAYYMSKSAQGFEQLILENSTIPNSPLTYKWLWNAFDRGRRLKFLIGMLEDEGMLTYRNFFQTASPIHNIEDSRRLLATVLLAAELYGCTSAWDEKVTMLYQETLYRSNDLLRHVYIISLFIVKQAYRFVENERPAFDGVGQNQLWSGLRPGRNYYRSVATILAEGVFLRGPSALVDLLARKYQTLKEVEKQIRSDFFGPDYQHLYPFGELDPAGTSRLVVPLISYGTLVLSQRREAEMRALGEPDELGLSTLDVAKWCTKIKNDEDWVALMKRWGWSKTIKLIPPQRAILNF